MRQYGTVDKGWGWEQIWVSNDHYCSKFLHFRKGGKSSLHFHRDKRESWYIVSGVFEVTWLHMTDATKDMTRHTTGQVIDIETMIPHQIRCLEAGTILEVSTPDSVVDNYRVEPGDSQKEKK